MTHSGNPLEWTTLQSRDPFSGDCDVAFIKEHGEPMEKPLQSRDPFSGDCDAPSGAVVSAWENCLQSRDPFSGDCDLYAVLTPMPVSRATCRAETRSQGIATKKEKQRGLVAPIPVSGRLQRNA